MHGGMQRLHPAVEHLGEAGDLLHRRDRDAGGAERGGGAAGGDDLPAELRQALREGDDARACR